MTPDMSSIPPLDPLQLPGTSPQAAPLPGLAPATPTQPAPPAAPAQANAVEVAVAQTKQLISQYQHDPYKLSGALEQLKADYIARQFGVRANAGDN